MSFFYQKILSIVIRTWSLELENEELHFPLSLLLPESLVPLFIHACQLCSDPLLHNGFLYCSMQLEQTMAIIPTPATAPDLHRFLIPGLNPNINVLEDRLVGLAQVRSLLLVLSAVAGISGSHALLFTQEEVWSEVTVMSFPLSRPF